MEGLRLSMVSFARVVVGRWVLIVSNADVTQSARGHAALRAYRLSASFREVYKKGRFTSEQ
jgi:hypothetical protein